MASPSVIITAIFFMCWRIPLRTQGLIVLRYSFLIHFLKVLNRNGMLFLSPINEIYRKRVILLKYMCVNGDIYSRSGIGQ